MTPFAVLMVASITKRLNRILSKLFAVLAVGGWEQGQIDRRWQGKSAAFGPAHVIDGVEVLWHDESGHAVVAPRSLKQINASRVVGLPGQGVRHHEPTRQ